MGREYDTIDEHLASWIARQPLFFVGSAPLDAGGHVNVSPKGPIGSLRVLGPTTLAYLDIYGSGAETIAHLRENGRIVVMLCAFSGPPRIVRLHGHGEVLLPGDERFDRLLARAAFAEPSIPEARRSVVHVEVTRIADSCGYGVPLMAYEGRRPHTTLSAQKRLRTGGPEAIEAYIAERNATSIDGLAAVDPPKPAAA
ncbi:MAG TPA: pyridoxamine 5'-phosphate oxidase family protein [Thermoleophilaceae bacterium]|nr:pyridoxamine 5'-phosphate oxidase family protein [Thermoleophilaceae bacterium]